jgi:hypothetical protein
MPTSAFRACSLAAAAAVLLAAGIARADCVDGMRDMTAAERAYHQRGVAALAAALPGPPAGAERKGRPFDFKAPSLSAGASVCGAALGNFNVTADAGYLYTFPKAEADRLYVERRAVVERIRAIEALPPDKAAEMKAIEDQVRATYAQMPTRKRSDPPFTPEQQALVNQKTAEARVFEQKAREVRWAHELAVKPQIDPLKDEERRLETNPQDFGIFLKINVDRPPPVGATPWEEVAVFGAPANSRAANLRIVNVVLQVRGPPGPARTALFNAVDSAWLKTLVGQAPPEVAASEAQAARLAAAAPAAVAPVQVASPVGSPAPSASSAPQLAAPPAAPSAAPSAAPPAAPPAAQPAAAATAPAVPAAAAAPPAAPAPPPAGAPQAVAPRPDCPPRGAQAGNQAASAGATIGGAVLGGGFGRNMGSMIGGALGAVTQAPVPPGCPN